jgi:anti-sigma regulatory factor (Ser/Thr protein kinase)
MNDLSTKPDKQKNPCGTFTKIVYEVPSHRNEITNLSKVAIERIEKLGVETDFHQLELVLLEALTNALLYGNLEVPSKVRDTEGEDVFWQLVDEREKDSNFSSRNILLEIDCAGKELRFTVTDRGDGFDWRKCLKSMDMIDPERLHNRGVFLIQSFVDTLMWNEKGNEIMFSIKVGLKSQD